MAPPRAVFRWPGAGQPCSGQLLKRASWGPPRLGVEVKRQSVKRRILVSNPPLSGDHHRRHPQCNYTQSPGHRWAPPRYHRTKMPENNVPQFPRRRRSTEDTSTVIHSTAAWSTEDNSTVIRSRATSKLHWARYLRSIGKLTEANALEKASPGVGAAHSAWSGCCSQRLGWVLLTSPTYGVGAAHSAWSGCCLPHNGARCAAATNGECAHCHNGANL